jgi:hypothetical protein
VADVLRVYYSQLSGAVNFPRPLRYTWARVEICARQPDNQDSPVARKLPRPFGAANISETSLKNRSSSRKSSFSSFKLCSFESPIRHGASASCCEGRNLDIANYEFPGARINPCYRGVD